MSSPFQFVRRLISLVKLTGLVLMSSALGGCASPAAKFERRIEAAGLMREVVQGSAFVHLVYSRGADAPQRRSQLVIVFIEGDGTPWSHNGERPSSDPTPREPLALELMLRTSQPAWYLTRPCYNGMSRDPGCSAAVWTGARYSKTAVDSLVAALKRYAESHGEPKILLIGYSGGGALAILMAAQLRDVVGVITVAANLDVSAWTRVHDYLPLTESLNPATQSVFSPAPEIDFVGDRDANVPFSTLVSYFTARPQATVWHYEDFDHVCCWVGNWPALLQRALEKIGGVSNP